MRAYGIDFPESDGTVKLGDKEFRVCTAKCDSCQYAILFAALPEHESSYCPNCGIKIRSAYGVKND